MKNLKHVLRGLIKTLTVPTIKEQIAAIKYALPLTFTENEYDKILEEAPKKIITIYEGEIRVSLIGIYSKNARCMFLCYYDMILPFYYHMIRLRGNRINELQFDSETADSKMELRWLTFNPDAPSTNAFLALLHQWNSRYEIQNIASECLHVSLSDIGFKDYVIGEHKKLTEYSYRMCFYPKKNIVGYEVQSDEFSDSYSD